MIEKGKRLRSVRNNRGTKVKRCCASCRYLTYTNDLIPDRECMLWEEIVEARDRCKRWVMSDGMKKAGIGTGVVRDIVTKEVIIH